MTDTLPSSVDGVDSTRSVSQGRLILRRFLRGKTGLISLIVLVATVVFATSAIGIGPIPGWWKWNYYDPSAIVDGGNPTLQLWPFSLGDHPFGQDRIGRDYFAMTMRGIQNSFGHDPHHGYRGRLGRGRRCDRGLLPRMGRLRPHAHHRCLHRHPAIVIAAVVGNFAGALGVWLLGIMLGFFSWMVVARLVRGEFLTLREREFVEAARVAGASDGRIIFRHILPNAAGVILVAGSLLAASAILLEAAISVLGYGIRSPDVSLGLLIGANQSAFSVRPWLFWWPALFIVLLALSVNVFGDALREAFDPRSSRFSRRRTKDAPSTESDVDVVPPDVEADVEMR